MKTAIKICGLAPAGRYRLRQRSTAGFCRLCDPCGKKPEKCDGRYVSAAERPFVGGHCAGGAYLSMNPPETIAMFAGRGTDQGGPASRAGR